MIGVSMINDRNSGDDGGGDGDYDGDDDDDGDGDHDGDHQYDGGENLHHASQVRR